MLGEKEWGGRGVKPQKFESVKKRAEIGIPFENPY